MVVRGRAGQGAPFPLAAGLHGAPVIFGHGGSVCLLEGESESVRGQKKREEEGERRAVPSPSEAGGPLAVAGYQQGRWG